MIIPAEQLLVGYRNGVLAWDAQLLRDGGVFNADGWTGAMQFRPAPGAAGSPYISLSTEADPTAHGSYLAWVDPFVGLLSLRIAILDWPLFPLTVAVPPTAPSVSYWDIVLTDPDGVEDPYVNGALNLYQGVTRS
jgi:hypothetical protein